MLSKRILTSIVLIAVLIGSIFYFPRPIVAVIIALLIGSGLWELYLMCGQKGQKPFSVFGISAGIILSVATYLILSYNLTFEANEAILIILFLTLAAILIKYTFKKDGSSVIVNVSVTMLGVLYVSFLFTFVIKLRFLPANPVVGMGWVMSYFIITKISDISAYFFGMKFGKHKLIPRISAKKSIEGAIASVVGAVLVSLLLGMSFLSDLSWPRCVLLGALVGAIGQVGDLAESLMKRDAQIKDSGKFVPGLGGVLDFMDSLLFTGPVMYMFMKYTL